MYNVKKIAKFIAIAIIVAIILMFIEYRVIMTHQQIEVHNNGAVSSTIFGITDLYNTGNGGAL